jgi:hypothetical protein
MLRTPGMMRVFEAVGCDWLSEWRVGYGVEQVGRRKESGEGSHDGRK